MHQPAPAVHRATEAQRRRWTEAGEQHAICLPLSKLQPLQLHQYHTCFNHVSVPAQTSCFSLSVWVWVTICGSKMYDCRNALIKPPPAIISSAGAVICLLVSKAQLHQLEWTGPKQGMRVTQAGRTAGGKPTHTRHYDCLARQSSRDYVRICQDHRVCISRGFAAKLRTLPLRLEQMTSRLQGNLHLAATNSKHRLAQGASLKTLPPSSAPVSLRPHLMPGPALILHSPSTLFLPCIIRMN